MGDLLKDGSDWLEGQRTDHMARTVTYQRGGLEVDVLATVGRTPFRIDSGYGVTIRQVSRDFLILAADLVLDGDLVLPQDGDRIVEVVGDQVYVSEVMPYGDEPAWRHSDLYRKTLRIHTKLVATEGAPEEPESALAVAASIGVTTALEA